MLKQRDVLLLVTWLRVQPLTGSDRERLEAHAKVVDGSQDSWAWFQGSESESERELRLLAALHADREGFREEWRA